MIAESPGAPLARAARCARYSREGDGVICWWSRSARRGARRGGPRHRRRPHWVRASQRRRSTSARTWAVDQSGDQRAARTDLYGGIGDAAVLLAARGAQVVSVDVDEKAIAWRTCGAGSARFIAARGWRTRSPPPSGAASAAVPRAGLHWNVTLKLREQPVFAAWPTSRATRRRWPRRPAPQRELRRHVRRVRPVPQTADVETVVASEAA